jgi:NAD-dependent dihydropyrimidine dehydrogenase PreA subunit
MLSSNGTCSFAKPPTKDSLPQDVEAKEEGQRTNATHRNSRFFVAADKDDIHSRGSSGDVCLGCRSCLPSCSTGEPPSSGDKALAVLKGVSNTVEAVTSMVGSLADAAILQLKNTGGGPALDLQVQSDKAPMTVNSETKVQKLNADKVDGKDSTEFLTSCPTGTQSLGGACIETTMRGTDPGTEQNPGRPPRLAEASSTCAGIDGGRLPTGAELESFRQKPDVTIGMPRFEDGGGGEWTGDVIVGEETGTPGAMTIDDNGTYENSSSNSLHTFRCVVSPS